jgi:hypothetical protein
MEDGQERTCRRHLAAVLRLVGLDAPPDALRVTLEPLVATAQYRCEMVLRVGSEIEDSRNPLISTRNRGLAQATAAAVEAVHYAGTEAAADIAAALRRKAFDRLTAKRDVILRRYRLRVKFSEPCGDCVRGRVVCARCGGRTESNRLRQEKYPCNRCMCTRTIEVHDDAFSGQHDTIWGPIMKLVPCPPCRGTGSVTRDRPNPNYCAPCRGSGRTACARCRGAGRRKGHVRPLAIASCTGTTEVQPGALAALLPWREIAVLDSAGQPSVGEGRARLVATTHFQAASGGWDWGDRRGAFHVFRNQIRFAPFLDARLRDLAADAATYAARTSGDAVRVRLRRLPRTPAERSALLGLGSRDRRADRLRRALRGSASDAAIAAFMDVVDGARRWLRVVAARTVAGMAALALAGGALFL